MKIKEVLYSQYDASLKMLKSVITSADGEIWNQKNENNAAYWHIAYHILYYVDCYLYKDLNSFNVWDKHKKNYQYLGQIPNQPDVKPNITESYTKAEILEYFELIHSTLKQKLEGTDMEADSGFYWVPVNKLELQLYNIRHIQHHTGQLAFMLRDKRNIGTKWIVKGE